MGYKPLISIISPTYNHERYIEECIESVLCQSYENWEMIIVDDASTDKTPEIVQKYVNKDSRIKLIRHNENYGSLYLDKTYNEALSLAKGEWIAILEGDDVWLPYKLEKQVEILNKYLSENIVLLSSFPGFIREDLNIVTVPNLKVSLSFKNIPKNKPYNAMEFLLLGLNPVYSQTALIKREVLEKVGGFIQKPREIRLVDFPTWLR
ncbi:MAG: glycosyltransferase family 2 protein, partial [Caldimicrobium sp.]